MDLSGGTRGFGRGSRRTRNRRLRPRNRRWREAGREFRIRRAANRQGFGPDGEPAGKPECGFGSGRTPEEAAPGPPVQARHLETAQRGMPRLPGRFTREGTVGAGGNAGPHYCLRALSGRWTRLSRSAFGASDSSRCRLASRRALNLRIRARDSRGRGEAPVHVSQATTGSERRRPSRARRRARPLLHRPGGHHQRRPRHRRPAPCRRPDRRQRPLRPAHPGRGRRSSPATSSPTRRGSPARSRARYRRAA